MEMQLQAVMCYFVILENNFIWAKPKFFLGGRGVSLALVIHYLKQRNTLYCIQCIEKLLIHYCLRINTTLSSFFRVLKSW